jgi:hypothetical protein
VVASLVVLAVAENRRCAFVLEAAARLGWPAPRVVHWRDFLADPAALDRALDAVLAQAEPSRPLWLRVDSPGEDWDVERALIAWGADVEDPDAPRAERISAAAASSLAFERGRVRLGRQWYLGFVRALARVRESVSQRTLVRLTSDTDEIAALFDKRATHARLSARAVPTTPLLASPDTADALRALTRERDERRVFVKLWHGSSASGVVALRWDEASIAATTSAELAYVEGEWRLFNSLRVRRYTDEADVRVLLDALFREGAIVERWMPKATFDGDNYDLRVVTIDGRARHAVVRVGRSPMTNLHLGNRRGDLDRVRARLGDDRWQSVRARCESVAEAFAQCNVLGVDVMLSPNLQDIRVIEANAFGDLLPNILDDGDDTYTAALRSLV